MNKAGSKCLQLLFGDMEVFHNGIYEGIYNNVYRLVKCNVIQFLHQTENS